MRPRSLFRPARSPLLASILALIPLGVASEKQVSYHFSHFAGSTLGGPGSVDGTGPRAQFRNPAQVARDSAGNLYVADRDNHTIRKITPSGVVTTLAGRAGVPGFADGSGASARFNRPAGVAVDARSNLYVSDSGNYCIRRISPDGNVTTTVGLPGFYGNQDGMGTAVRFSRLEQLAFAPDGALIVIDAGNAALRRITDDLVVNTLLKGSPSINGLAFDPDGNIYTASEVDSVVYRITPNGQITIYAGVKGERGNADGTAAQALFDVPRCVARDAAGNLFVGEYSTIRKISPAGQVTTLSRAVTLAGYIDGPVANATFRVPISMLVDPEGRLVFTERDNHVVRMISTQGIVSTLAGASIQDGREDGVGTDARFFSPWDITVAPDGTVFVSDALAHTLRQITPAGVVSTLAGGSVGAEDGTGRAAKFYTPTAIAVDLEGSLLVCDSDNHAIRRVTRSGVVTTYAGSLGSPGTTDGFRTAARFRSPDGIAVDSHGNVFVADTWNYTIRKISPTGMVTTFAGAAETRSSRDGNGASASFSLPRNLAIDRQDNLYVADQYRTVRKITPTGTVISLAGTINQGGDRDGPGSVARFGWIAGLGIDADGNVIVADDDCFRQVTPQGVVSTIWGSRAEEGSRNGEGSQARFNFSKGLAFDPRGNVYICDYGNRAIRKGLRIVKDPNATLRLSALSARCRAGSGDQTLIVGFVIDGAGGKETLIRGIGPTLAPLGVSNAMSDPHLQLFRLSSQGAVLTAENDNWGGSSTLADRFVQLGAQPALPADSKDAALLTVVQSGVYTAHLSSTSGQTGIALVEAYDADPSSAARFTALSTRTVAGTGDDTLIAGFVLDGSGTKNLLLRAVGPSLVSAGVPASSVLQNPTLKLYRMSGGTSTLVAENDDWSGATELKDVFAAVGAGALDGDSSKDAALLVTLEPGVYTAHVSSANPATGVALVEIFDAP